jgi:HK97 family phage portal protein
MGLFDDIRKRFRTAPVADPIAAAAVTSNTLGDKGRVGKEHAPRYRAWAERSEWIRAAINVRKSQISQSEWEILKFDPDGPEPDPARIAELKRRFNQPNPRNDSWRSFIEPIVEDILVLDAGVIEKERTLGRQVTGLWPVDGAKVKVNAYWAGDPKEARYYFYRQPLDKPVEFLNEDLIYMMESPATYRVVGLSKLETLQMTVDSELSGHMYNHRQVTNAAPDGMLDLGQGARPEQVNSFKRYWEAEVAGKGAMAFIGGTKDAKFIPFRGDNREMQFIEWQLYLVRKICAVFGLSPQDIAITDSVNRATADIQAEQTEDRGLRPLLGLLQEYLTREVVWDPTYGGPENNLCFRFTRLNLKESLTRAQINERALGRISWKTPNEARRQDGLQPLDGEQYDSLIALSSLGPVSLADVPTAREVMESKKPAAKTPPAIGEEADVPLTI